MLPRLVTAAALAALVLAPAARALAAPAVVASIVPIHGLVASVMEGVGEPHLLVPPGSSPHNYALRPSDAAALAGADLVVWVGPALETFLVDAVASRPAGAPLLTLMEAPGVTLLARRAGGAWQDAHAAEHNEDVLDHNGDVLDHAGAGSEHAHEGGTDPHIWLDPLNAQALVHAIGTALAALDPANAAAYWANVDATRSRIANLDTTLAGQLAAVQATPFVVFHDAYQYLEVRFSLTALGAIGAEPGQAPSAQRVADLRRRIVGLGAACVFAEPQFDAGLVETIAEGTGAKIGMLDPEGGVTPGPRAYDALMKALVNQLSRCLSG